MKQVTNPFKNIFLFLVAFATAVIIFSSCASSNVRFKSTGRIFKQPCNNQRGWVGFGRGGYGSGQMKNQ